MSKYVDNLVSLCRAYHNDPGFREKFESKYDEITKDLDEGCDRFYIDNCIAYSKDRKDLFEHMEGYCCELPAIVICYQIQHKGNKYPEYNKFCIHFKDTSKEQAQ